MKRLAAFTATLLPFAVAGAEPWMLAIGKVTDVLGPSGGRQRGGWADVISTQPLTMAAIVLALGAL